jgi:uncharacterized protein Smg (DUF494 family)
MNEEEYNKKKEELFQKLSNAGIDKIEIENKLKEEESLSEKFGLENEQGKVRAFISTINFYRKYLDRLGHRIKFLCLGITSMTDYGLRSKMKEIMSRASDITLSEEERDIMIDEGIIDSNGYPLHTKDTTLFEDKIGKPIDPDEETSQQMIGIIDNNGTYLPALIRVNSKKACQEKKIMYKWCLISGEQGSSKNYPSFVTINSRELLMKPLVDAERITMEEYNNLVEKTFKDYIYDVNDIERLKKLEENSTFAFFKNAALLNFEGNPLSTSIFSDDETMNLDNLNMGAQKYIVADAKISQAIDIDVDPNIPEKMWICVNVRKKKSTDLRLKIDIIGMYVENPIDRSKYEMNDDFMNENKIKELNKQDGNFFNKTETTGNSMNFIDEIPTK